MTLGGDEKTNNERIYVNRNTIHRFVYDNDIMPYLQ